MSEYSVHGSMQIHLEMKLERTVKALQANRMDACWVQTKEDALQKVEELLTKGALIASGGSMTLDECGITDLLRSGDYDYLDRAEVRQGGITELYRRSFYADCYLMSSNAVTEQGELYNVDGNGNRAAALIYGPSSVIVVAGANKIVPDIPAAIKRVRSLAAPVNAMRLHQDTPCAKTGICAGIHGELAAGCKADQRICCSYVVSGFQRVPNRIHVILVAENLGY